jgi:hypothetical protein
VPSSYSGFLSNPATILPQREVDCLLHRHHLGTFAPAGCGYFSQAHPTSDACPRDTRDNSATAIMLVLLIPSRAWAQHKHTQSGQKNAGMPGKSAEMSKMMQSPHHQLMMAQMKSMSEFARTLRDQAVKPQALDVEFAREAVAELRHCLDAMEAIHQKYMQTMSAKMQSKMQMMMEKMDKDYSMVKDQVSALETDVLL